MIQTDTNTVLREQEELERPKPHARVLPLVLEIIPGQAAEGLIEIFEAGTYEGKTLQELVDTALNKEDWSLEERQIHADIARQLQGGKLLWKGQEIQKGTATDYAVLQTTDAGEKYLYVPVRVIKPQEGGCVA